MNHSSKTKKQLIEEMENLQVQIEGLQKSVSNLENVGEESRIKGALYKSLIQASPDAIILTDRTLNVLMASNKAAKLYGYKKAEDLIGVNGFSLVSEQDSFKARSDVREVLKKGKIGPVEYNLKRADGSSFVAEMNISMIKNKKNRPEAFIAIFRDITVRKNDIRLLKKTAKEKELILKSVSEHIIFHDLDMRIVWANEAAASAVGKNPRDLVGRHCYEIWHGRSSKCECCIVEDVVKSGKSIEKEAEIPSGRYWIIRVYPVYGDNSKIIGAVEVTSDITDRRRVEGFLKNSEEKFRNISEEIPVGVGIIKGRHYVWVNRAFSEMFEYSEDEIINKDYDFFITPEERDILTKRIEARLSGKEVLPKYDVVGVTKNKRRIDVEVQARKVEFEGQEAIQVVIQDVTQRHKAERLLKRERDMAHLYFDLAGVIMLVLDSYGRVSNINNKGSQLLGYSVEEIIGKDWISDFIPDSYKPKVKSVLNRILMRDIKTTEYGENPVITKSGEERIIYWRNTLIEDESGEVISVLASGEDVTERRRVEKQLITSEERYRGIVEDQQELVCRFFPTGVLTFVNKAYCDYFQRDRDWLINRNFLVFVHEEAREKVEEVLGSLSRDNPVAEVQERVESDDGEIRWMKWVNRAIFNSEGIVSEVQAVGRDITEEKKSKEYLQRSEINYRTIFNGVNDALFIHDIGTGKIEDVNQKMLEMYGYSDRKEIVGRFVKDLSAGVFPYMMGEAKEKVRKAIEDGPQLFEWQAKKKDGTLFWVEVSLKKIKLLDKERLLAVVRDITSRKTIEKDIKENEKNYRLIFERANDGIVILDRELKIKEINPKVLEVLAYESKDELIGLDVINIVHPDYRGLVMKRARDRMDGKKVPSIYEAGFLRKDGEIAFIEVNAAITEYYGERVDFVVARDITQRKRAEQEILRKGKNYRAVFDTANDAIFVLDMATGNIIDSNYKATQTYGYKKEEFHELSIGDLGEGNPPYNQEYAMQWINRAMLDKPQLFEWKAKNNEGQVFWVEVNVKKVILDEKERLVAIMRDISKRKSAEERLSELNKELLEYNKKMEQLSLIDPQTGLYNYRYFEKVMEAEFDRSRRSVSPLSLIMVDIDYFQSVNDVYGHRFGDLVLNQFSGQLQKMVRKYDYVIRYAGEKFLIISPGVNRGTALRMSRRINEAFHLYHFGDDEHRLNISLSIAVVSYPEDRRFSGQGLVDLVRKVLRRAKQDGGDRVYSSQDKDMNGDEVKEINSNHELLEHKITKLTTQANRNLVESVLAFAKTIELKDQYTGEHVEKTVQYATEIAWGLNLPRDEVERIRQAAILHDLGKVGISENLLRKEDKLTEKEFKEIQKHPQIAADILRPIQFLHDVIPLIFYHHERWDGKGYPKGLKGKEIPIGARIIAVADVYQALVSDRPYRKRYPKSKAIKIIKNGAKKHFDPQVINVFMEVIKKGEN